MTCLNIHARQDMKHCRMICRLKQPFTFRCGVSKFLIRIQGKEARGKVEGSFKNVSYMKNKKG